MAILVGVTVLWAFSFSLIGVYLSGQVDSSFAVLTRITLALAVFAPMMRFRGIGRRPVLGLMAVGALELGLMYFFFYHAFTLLSVPEVLLFTIFTPVYITLIEDLLARRFSPGYLATALVAVAGAAVIRYTELGSDYWAGFAVVQGANLCFAAGQVGYRRLAPRLPADVPLHALFGWFFAGAWPLAALLFLLIGDRTMLPTTGLQWGVLLWLGLMSSGLGYYAWNRGAVRVDAGTLAVMNNALIPAGLAVNLLIWNRDADLARLAAGAVIIVAALVINRLWVRRRASQPGSASTG
ncbi:EamA family transporter [Salinisphaera orenii]|uniref:Membrane protein n=1 Tax=Salinisphaera orenii YIM 95161 TaxID=1051139 RepID=A0A423Q3X4_9GAMM|nr:EamA family transporter [Salinisphaera halophila]ROO33754.1 membrane protein [Salinisphaera halophila YIM 95161]